MKKYGFLFVFIVLQSCQNSKENNYNKMLDWTEQMEKGTTITVVKKYQPSYVTVFWDKPDSISKIIRYPIEPKYYFDPLNLSIPNYLAFDSLGGYVGRQYHSK